MRRLLHIIPVLLGLGLGAIPVEAQDILPATEYVDWNATAVPGTVAPGDAFDVRIQATIGEGWKMYALDSPRPSFGVEFAWNQLPEGIEPAGEMVQSEPITDFDPYFKSDVRYFRDRAEFSAPFRVTEEAPDGAVALEGTVRFMICNADLCLPPTPATLTVGLRIDASADPAGPRTEREAGGTQTDPSDHSKRLDGEESESVAGAGALRTGDNEGSGPDFTGGRDGIPIGGSKSGETAQISNGDDLDAARSGGVWGFLLLAIGAGLAALLTPCVFPMIPLTVSYFTKHTESRTESVRMASVYGASIVLTFTTLGVLTALFVGAAGAQTIAANPWINLFIGAVFVVFALSLLGLFELRLPNGLLNYFNRRSEEKKGYLGVLFMGLTLTLVSFSCTAPFVGGLLAATVSDEWAYPILGMLVFSATFSLPFVLFALFPKALSSLPRSGSWMNTVKVVLGFVELAAALKFLSNADLIWGTGLLTRPVAIAAGVVIFSLAGFYLLGKLRLRGEPPVETIGVVRMLCSVAFLGLALYLLPGLFGAPLNSLDAYLPPRRATDVSLVGVLSASTGATESDLPWFDTKEAAYAEARASGKPVFIDFTGYTCTNCRQMEANVFPREEVAELLRNEFILLRLYTDDQDRGPELQQYQLRVTGTVALPTYAIVDPENGSMISRLTGLASAREFAAFLQDGIEEYREDALALR